MSFLERVDGFEPQTAFWMMWNQIEHRFPIPRHDDRFALLDLSSKFGQAIFGDFIETVVMGMIVAICSHLVKSAPAPRRPYELS